VKKSHRFIFPTKITVTKCICSDSETVIYSMQNLKKTQEACQAFLSMKTEFPKAEAKVLERAVAEAKKLECK